MKKTFISILFVIVICIFKTNFLTAQINATDSLALVDFYNSTNGPHWTNHTNWLTTAPVSTWYGITVNGNRVTQIGFEANGLNGNLPSSIGNLTYLTILYLPTSNLTGSMPSSLGNLPHLQYLILSSNKLTGNIPSQLSNDTSLQQLILNHNKLSGNIPSSLGKLSLHVLQLNHNKLSGTIPSSLTNFDVAAGIYLENNCFTFAGMEQMVKKFPFISYTPQASIKLNKHGNIFSVYAGGANALADNTYKWYKGSTLVATITGDSTYQPTQSGNYSVKVKNSVATALTLYSDTVNYVAADNLIASRMNNTNSSITLYPNPAKIFSTLSFYADGKYAITITDISGKTLQTKTGTSIKGRNIIQLDISKYASGVYLITITDEKNTKQIIRLNKE